MSLFKNKKVYEHRYNSTLEFIFRFNNGVRAMGVYVMYESKKMNVSIIKNEYIGEWSSDILLFILGVAITLFGPDFIDWIRAKKIPVQEDKKK
jgi:hypothetical protein